MMLIMANVELLTKECYEWFFCARPTIALQGASRHQTTPSHRRRARQLFGEFLITRQNRKEENVGVILKR